MTSIQVSAQARVSWDRTLKHEVSALRAIHIRYWALRRAECEFLGVQMHACDLSITGAAREVSDPSAIPAKITLVVPEDGLKLPCRVVRRTVFRIGVVFDFFRRNWRPLVSGNEIHISFGFSRLDFLSRFDALLIGLNR